jgi:type IV secretion system protein VirB11
MTPQAQRLADLLKSAMRTIAPLVEDPEVLHLSVSHTGQMWAERFGTGAEDTGIMVPQTETEAVIRLVASYCGAVVTRESPRLAAILPSGERFQAFVPPVVRAPAFELRKRPTRIFTLGQYVATGIMTEVQAEVIRRAIRERKNIAVAGGTSSGKTTLLNACLYELKDAQDHVITLEDVPELQIAAPHYLALFTVPGQITLTDLVADCLRCNPTRVIVGEVRGAEALDVLDVWNTGHPGGMMSLHANRGMALERLESLVRRAPLRVPLPHEEIKRLIAEAIDVLVDIERAPGAPGRRVTAVTACHGLQSNNSYHLEVLA